jgi:hypothetical protein
VRWADFDILIDKNWYPNDLKVLVGTPAKTFSYTHNNANLISS